MQEKKRTIFLPTGRWGKTAPNLKHAFREVTSGFSKGTVPGASPLHPPGPLRMRKKKVKRNVLGTTPQAHLGEEHVKWLSGCAECRTRGATLPLHKAPRMPKILF